VAEFVISCSQVIKYLLLS